MQYFTQSSKKVLQSLDVDEKLGLRAKDVAHRGDMYRRNVLPEKKKTPLVLLFFSHLNDTLIYVLFVAVVITTLMGHYIDAIIILMVVILNAVIGVIQEYRAGKAVDALRKMASPHALVRRDGVVVEIDSSDVVVGDILILDAGRIVAADARLIESIELQVEESALTGESAPSKKDATIILDDPNVVIGDRKNMVYMSTVVTAGRGTAVVTAVGVDTDMGHIADILESEPTVRTPLEERLDGLGKILGQLAIGICILIFIVWFFQWRDLADMFLIAVSLAVASIPEGLPAIVAVVLSIGITQMSKKNAIVKRLPAVETLGSVDIICSDKTGTLTENKMTVVEVYIHGESIHMPQKWAISAWALRLIEGMVLASDATLEDGITTGDPTEVALLMFADSVDMDRKVLGKKYKRIHEIPFDSDRKMMSTIVENADGMMVATKGAIDTILTLSTHILRDGKEIPITDKDRKTIMDAMRRMSDKALRTLGYAYRRLDTLPENRYIEENLTFVGFVGMIDPPRASVKRSIQIAKQAGITPVMITGDYAATAFAIAQELGIADDMNEVITGQEIDTMSDSVFKKKIHTYRVFARVSPEHKVRIVRAFRARWHVVSMTGDGVNDAPSLNAADIGVAMGITGTDVAKGAADIILVDDNFSTIVVAVERGRNIYNNIRKSVMFLLSCNLGEVVAMFIVLLVGMESPLLAIQLLWINLVTDSLPAIAMGMSPNDPTVMDEKPRKPQESFFSHGIGPRTIFFGTLMGMVTIAAFLYGYWIHDYSPFSEHIPEHITEYARTLAFITIVLTQMFFAFSIQYEHYGIFSRKSWENRILIAVIVLAIGLQIILIYTPMLSDIFHLTSISGTDWDVVIALAWIPFLVNEIRKWWQYRWDKKS